jgi:hypothetical protein
MLRTLARTLASALPLALAASSASAGALAPAKASDLVVVGTSPGAIDCIAGGKKFDVRVLPDGTTEPFVIPPKKVLVITSFQFVVSSDPNRSVSPSVNVVPGALTVQRLIMGAATTDANGNASGSVVVPNGVRVHAEILCLGNGGEHPFGLVQGFFAKDK